MPRDFGTRELRKAAWNQEAPRFGAEASRIEIKIDRIVKKSGDISQKVA
jgi:hypothetical protein